MKTIKQINVLILEKQAEIKAVTNFDSVVKRNERINMLKDVFSKDEELNSLKNQRRLLVDDLEAKIEESNIYKELL